MENWQLSTHYKYFESRVASISMCIKRQSVIVSQSVSQQGQFDKQISNLSWAKSSSKIAVGDCITLIIKNSSTIVVTKNPSQSSLHLSVDSIALQKSHWHVFSKWTNRNSERRTWHSGAE